MRELGVNYAVYNNILVCNHLVPCRLLTWDFVCRSKFVGFVYITFQICVSDTVAPCGGEAQYKGRFGLLYLQQRDDVG